MSDPESKLIIDEDWKSQARAEKERLEKEAHPAQGAREARPDPGVPNNPAAAAPPDSAAPQGEAEAATGTADRGHYPPASLQSLISMLATQAMVALGQIPLPGSEGEIDLEQAQHFIDTLAVLEQKTAGNCTPAEAQILKNLLHDLRLAYIAVQKHVASTPGQ
jgi:hypothetical protein